MTAILIGILTVFYCLGVVQGEVPAERRIDMNTLVLLVMAAIAILLLVKPGILDRLKLFRLGSDKAETQPANRLAKA